MTMYAWSRIALPPNDKGRPVFLEWGETVTADKVGGEDELKVLSDEGIVREYAPPSEWVESGEIVNVSAVRYMLDKQNALRDASAGGPQFGGSVAAPPLEEILLGVGAGEGYKTAVEEGATEEVDTMKARIAELEADLAKAKKTT